MCVGIYVNKHDCGSISVGVSVCVTRFWGGSKDLINRANQYTILDLI